MVLRRNRMRLPWGGPKGAFGHENPLRESSRACVGIR